MSPTVKARLRLLAAVAALGLALAVSFIAFPRLDLAAAEIFFVGPRTFLLSRHPLGLFLNTGVQRLTSIVIAALLAGLLWTWLRRQRVMSLGPREFVYVILCFAIGPGLLTNVVLKEHWGRARPSYTQEFGGPLRYSPPFVISDQCQRNCSFVSGDASSAFAFLAFAPVAARRRRLCAGAAIGFGSMIALSRMLQGAHYLSDVLFAGIFTALVVLALRELVLEDGCLAPWLRGSMSRIRAVLGQAKA